MFVLNILWFVCDRSCKAIDFRNTVSQGGFGDDCALTHSDIVVLFGEYTCSVPTVCNPHRVSKQRGGAHPDNRLSV